MKQIPKDARTRIENAMTELLAEAETVADLIEKSNIQISKIRENIGEGQQKYNDKIAEIKDIYQELASQAQNYYDERSEKWQESDAGNVYEEWIDALGSPEIEELEIELPDEIEEQDFPDFTDDSWLPPTEPGE